MDTDEQWRIDNAQRLYGLQLQLRPYTAWSKEWEHDHCAACWAKFAEFEGGDIQDAGYATGPDYAKGAGFDWVCRRMVADDLDLVVPQRDCCGSRGDARLSVRPG